MGREGGGGVLFGHDMYYAYKLGKKFSMAAIVLAYHCVRYMLTV